MKAKIYKISPNTMSIVSTYNKVKDITDDRTIYRTLNGESHTFKDGYIYRRDKDVIVDIFTNKVVDLLLSKTKHQKKYEKYQYVIDLINNNTENLTIPQITQMAMARGISISEATCRKLKKEFELPKL